MEIKSGTSAYTSLTASQAFAYCYNLRASSTTLGNNTLDPHLTLNSDWGATLYLAASVYGVNTTTRNTIKSSTTGNESGVKNFGSTKTQTSSLYGGTVYGDSKRINLEKFLNTKYVENIDTSYSASSTRGQAIGEVQAWDSWYPANSSYPIIVRCGSFGVYCYNMSYNYGNDGDGRSGDATFRPVIWN
jgi:hypothetical protein